MDRIEHIWFCINLDSKIPSIRIDNHKKSCLKNWIDVFCFYILLRYEGSNEKIYTMKVYDFGKMLTFHFYFTMAISCYKDWSIRQKPNDFRTKSVSWYRGFLRIFTVAFGRVFHVWLGQIKVNEYPARARKGRKLLWKIQRNLRCHETD